MGRNLVAAGGVLFCLAFVLIQFTGSGVDEHVAQAIATTLALLLFGALGTTGIALAHWQPRFSLLGVVTTTLALLAGGATIVLTWSQRPSFFFLFFEGTSGRVAAITDLLAIVGVAACMLLATKRPGEDVATRLIRFAAIGSLAVLIALAILLIIDNDASLGASVYGILAAAFAFATTTLLVLRLLPLEERLPATS